MNKKSDKIIDKISITLDDDVEIPEGYQREVEFRPAQKGDFYLHADYNEWIKTELSFRDSYQLCLKPIVEPINYHSLINNSIICEFSESPDFRDRTLHLSFLLRFSEKEFVDLNGKQWPYCRPVGDILFGHSGNTCPLPRRTVVKVTLRNGDNKTGYCSIFDWEKRGYECDIISYKVIHEKDISSDVV